MTTIPSEHLHLSHKRHRDDNWVDRITIDIAPRWKTSGLSGDEWRFSHTVTLWRKGHVVHEQHVGTIDYAAAWVSLKAAEGFCPAEQPWPADAPGQPCGDGVLCDQPGCPDSATWRGILTQVYARNGDGPLPTSLTYYRVFCDQHKRRGDCSREDCDDNYTWEPIEAAAPQAGE